MNIMENSILYGGDYNPDQWPEPVWNEDIELMKKAGVNLVSLGIFSWANLQGPDEVFDFGWLDRIVQLLWSNGISIDMATATASPPPWLATRFPDVFPVDREGKRLYYGSRQTYCPNSPAYRKYSVKMAEAMARRYGSHPSVVLWHVNNEYACHTPACYCDTCAAAFRIWLKDKYKTVDGVNQAWGTSFWSQRYYDWQEILPPRISTAQINPSQQLDYSRFMSDSILECYLGEKRVLNEISPAIPVTTNFMPDFKPLDYFKWARHIDIVSWDSYPDPAPETNPAEAALNHDIMRGLKGGRPFLLMEQAPSQVNWRAVNTNKRPGVMRRISYQALGHGADGILFFQWRQSRKGAEKYHSSMVTHTGKTDSRIFREVEDLGRELANLGKINGTRIPARAALLFDYENWWAVEYTPGPSSRLNYLQEVRVWYNELFSRNIAVDIVPADGSLEGYGLVIAPLLHMVKKGTAENLEVFVEAGGVFLTTYFSGIIDEEDGVFTSSYPGPLKKLLGIEVEEFDALTESMKNRILWNNGGADFSCACTHWCDVVKLAGARTMAVFGDDYHRGNPAVTRNQFGKGSAWYVATRPDGAGSARILDEVCALAGLEPPLKASRGIEVCRRTSADREWLIVLNSGGSSGTIDTEEISYLNLLDNRTVKGKRELQKEEVLVLAREII